MGKHQSANITGDILQWLPKSFHSFRPLLQLQRRKIHGMGEPWVNHKAKSNINSYDTEWI